MKSKTKKSKHADDSSGFIPFGSFDPAPKDVLDSLEVKVWEAIQPDPDEDIEDHEVNRCC